MAAPPAIDALGPAEPKLAFDPHQPYRSRPAAAQRLPWPVHFAAEAE